MTAVKELRSLADYIDRHKDAPFLICGLGTSIDQFPDVFFNKFRKTGGIIITINEAAEFIPSDYNLDVNKYHDKGYYALLDSSDNEIRFEFTSPSDSIDIEKTGRLSMRGSGAVPAITAAYQMGAGEIYLLGIDFKRGADGRVYCYSCPKPAPQEYQLADIDEPELQATIRCIQNIAEAYKKVGVKIVNLSMNSVFPEGEL